jgi:hypothetical protein
MRKVREVPRLKHTLGMSLRQISEATGVGKTVVGEYVRRARVIGITWPVPEAIDDAELERRLFPPPCETGPPRPAIDWRKVHEEMKRRSVTLVLLWEEYRAQQADGYGYSRFCDLYGEWRKTISATMRQTHSAGEEAVRRLRRRHGAGIRSDNECGASRPHLRRRARGIQLRLCGGALVGGACRLDRRPHQYLCGDRWRAEGSGVRQSPSRRHQAVALRARHQSHLSGSGGALRLCRAAGAGIPPS